MRFGAALLIVVFCGACCFGAGPVISHTFQSGETAAFPLNIDLWIDCPDIWRLHLACPDGITVDCETWEGKGGGYVGRTAHFAVDQGQLGVGCHCLRLEITMEGAQALLGLPSAGGYWLLPLNGPNVQMVKASGERVELVDGEWVLLKPNSKVVFNGMELGRTKEAAAFGSAATNNGGGALGWITGAFHLEAGDEREVVLRLTGPLPAGELHLTAGEGFALGSVWSLGGTQLAAREADSQHEMIIDLPSLEQGEHWLRGWVRGLLPAEKRTSQLRAIFFGSEAVLTLLIDRGWFDFSHLHFIEAGKAPFPSVFLLPDRSLRYPDARGRIAVESENLAAVIPLANPAHPLWVGVPMAESLSAPSLSGAGIPSFILPVFIWEGDFRWRLIAKRGDWLADLSSERRQVMGQLGPLRFGAADGKFSLRPNFTYYESEKGWRWWEGPAEVGGSWRSGDFSGTVVIPRSARGLPSYSFQYENTDWLVRISRNDAALSFNKGKLNYGAAWRTKSVWVRAIDGTWRLDGGCGWVKFRFDKGFPPSWSLQIDLGQKWRFYLGNDWMDVYARAGGQQDTEWGARVRMPVLAAQRHALTTAVFQQKKGIGLFEISHREGYQFSPSLAVYLQGSVRAVADQVRFDYGAGLIYTPVPQLLGNLDWSREGGLRLRAGLVIPFVRTEK